jgi:alkylation response protein AidB-like acyl-CoA dehydrogenase
LIQTQLPPALAELQAEVRAFVQAELAAGSFVPHCDPWFSSQSVEFTKKLAAHGWLGMTFPKKYGGQGRSAVERFVMVAELLAAGAPVTTHWIADRQSGPLILKIGTEEQRERFIPAIARGECYFAIGMSEPDSGSDLASLKTKGVKVDGGWRLTGTKVWTSHAHHSHYALTMCRTDPDEKDSHKALSQMILDLSSPGVTVQPIKVIDGEQHFCQIILDDVFVPDNMVIGTVGQGWQQVIAELSFERSGPERFLSTYPLFSAWVKYVKQHPNPTDTEIIGKLTAEAMALYHLSMHVAIAIDNGGAPGTEAAIVKLLGNKFEADITETVRQRVDTEDFPESLRDLYEEAVLHRPAFALRGGTTEILRGLVSRNLVTR